MHKYLILLLIIGITATGSWFLPAQQEITVKIREGMPMVPVAIPEFVFQSGSQMDEPTRALLYETLQRDLEFSRVFRLIPREHHSYISRFNPASINFKDWASIQAGILVVGKLEVTTENRLIFQVQVFDVTNEKSIFSKNIGSKKENARLLAHSIADEIMKQFGEKPLFTSKIVYVSGNQNNQEISMMDYDGARPIRLTFNEAVDLLPSWSRDNERILYTSYRRMAPDLFLFDIYSGKTSLISSGGSNFAADWSPADDKIVYSSSKKGNHEIFLRNILTGQEKQLTFNPAIDTSPTWSPNSREIAFISSRSGTPQLYIMDTDGANVRRITYEGSYHDSPTWSPDGSRIAFVSRIENRFDIYVYQLSTNSYAKLTENAGRNENPTWSPDSRHLAFASNRSGHYQIYLVDYDGQNVRPITGAGDSRMPRWQKTLH